MLITAQNVYAVCNKWEYFIYLLLLDCDILREIHFPILVRRMWCDSLISVLTSPVLLPSCIPVGISHLMRRMEEFGDYTHCWKQNEGLAAGRNVIGGFVSSWQGCCPELLLPRVNKRALKSNWLCLVSRSLHLYWTILWAWISHLSSQVSDWLF